MRCLPAGPAWCRRCSRCLLPTAAASVPEGMKPWCDKPIGVPGTALKAALEAE
jgi:hypothetical protein